VSCRNVWNTLKQPTDTAAEDSVRKKQGRPESKQIQSKIHLLYPYHRLDYISSTLHQKIAISLSALKIYILEQPDSDPLVDPHRRLDDIGRKC